MLLGADRNLIRAGLFGYNGILTGIGLAFFLQLNWSAALIVYIILGGVVSTIVFIALANVFSTWDTPALTAPFVLTTWLFLLPKAAFHSLQPVPLAEVDSPEHILSQRHEDSSMVWRHWTPSLPYLLRSLHQRAWPHLALQGYLTWSFTD